MATTWSSTGSRSAKAVCTTGNEAAPSAATDGMELSDVRAIGISVSADAGQTISNTAGVIRFGLWDDQSLLWGPALDIPDLAITVSGVRKVASAGFEVLSSRGRLAAWPVGVTMSAGGLTIHLNATSASGQWL